MNASHTNLADDKARLRQKILQLRKVLFVQMAAQAAVSVADHGLAFFSDKRKGVVAGYYPVHSELSPLPLMKALGHSGWKTALPVVVAKNTALEFLSWRDGDAMDIGAHSIPCPAQNAPCVVPDIVLVPMLAFDPGGYRLGYGGGYYDRTLQNLRRQGRVIAIGLAFAGQMVDEVPRDRLDQKLDLVLSEEGFVVKD